MTSKAHTLLSEKNIYVSWGILILAISCTYMLSTVLWKVDQLTPIVQEVQSLNIRVTKIETQLGWLDENYTTKFVNK